MSLIYTCTNSARIIDVMPSFLNNFKWNVLHFNWVSYAKIGNFICPRNNRNTEAMVTSQTDTFYLVCHLQVYFWKYQGSSDIGQEFGMQTSLLIFIIGVKPINNNPS